MTQGNGEDLGITSTYARDLSKILQTNVFAYDYSGYGISDGKPNESNCYADIRAAYTYLIAERRIPPDRILLFGRSLGSGPTIDLAAALGASCAGVVLIGGLTSCVRVLFSNITNTIKFDKFANIDKIDKVLAPVFCVHGVIDSVVPFDHGLELFRRAPYTLVPLWVREAGHNDLEGPQFQDIVFERYAQVLEEFRAWRRPQFENRSEHRRKGSTGMGKAIAGCFFPAKSSRKTVNATPNGLVRESADKIHHGPRRAGQGRLTRTASEDTISQRDRDVRRHRKTPSISRFNYPGIPMPEVNERRPSSPI